MMLQQSLAWNGHKMADDWNPRSLSSFQTFPRNSSPPGSASPAEDGDGLFNGKGSTSSSSSSASSRHGHSKSLLDSSTPVRNVHGHSRSLGNATEFRSLSDGYSSLLDEDSIRVEVVLGPNDRRFGFSVVGGSEEGFSPRIDEIAPGSPADKADLEIGDEILEVNGKSLEGATHTEVISHIHQCIRSRTICLRVKRKSGNKLAQDLAANSNVQDAFVIAVEKQARERLERLSALKKIKPVDMTKLSQQLSGGDGSSSQQPAASAGLNGTDGQDDTGGQRANRSPSPVADGPGDGIEESQPVESKNQPEPARIEAATSASGGVSLTVSGSPSRHATIISPFGSPSTWIVSGDPQTSDVHINGDHVTQVRVDASSVLNGAGGQERSATPPTPLVPPPPLLEMEVDRDQDEEWTRFAMPASPVVSLSVNNSSVATVQVEHNSPSPTHSEAQLKQQQQQNSGSRESVSSHSGGGGRVKTPAGSAWTNIALDETRSASTGGPAQAMGALNGNPSSYSSTGAGSSRGTSQRSLGGSTTHSSEGSDSVIVNMAEWDTGPHREMAVDVPESFVGRTKTPPRYPPPKPANSTSSTATASAVTSTVVAVVNPPANTSPGLRKKVTVAQASAAGSNGVPGKPVPPPRDHLRIEEDGRLVNRAPAPQLPTRPADMAVGAEGKAAGAPPSKAVGVEVDTPTAEQLERIRKYQEDDRKRKEKEERLAREEEFLRSSLRGSRKLQALEQSPPSSLRPSLPAGVVNVAYTPHEHDDDESKLNGSDLSGTDGDDPGFTNAGLAWALAQNNYLLNSGMQKIIGIQEVTAALQRVQQQLKKNGHVGQGVEADLAAVQSLLLSPSFRSALNIHTKVQEVWCCGQPTLPAHYSVQNLVSECVMGLQHCASGEAVELIGLLGRYEMEGLLYAHDRIADQSRIGPPLGADSTSDVLLDDDIPPESTFLSSSSLSAHSPSHMGDKTFKIIRLEKTNEPLGATVRNDGESVVVGRIVRGGVAERSGLLHEGDEILEVNGIEVRGKSINDVCDLVGSMTGTITFLIVPAASTNAPGIVKPILTPNQPNVVHLKAHFDYDPEDDLYIPCKELGISFMKGDILHVISQDDPNWWQAFREGEEDQTLAGLIPSRSFQQQREAMKQAMVIDTMESEITTSKGTTSTLLCAKKQQKKKKKKTSFRSAFGKEENEEVLTYEEVGLYYPRANHKRPIVLIGPSNIGRKELREMLMQDSERFAPAIPHTSRTKKENEVNGQDYHFISRTQFEADIVNRKFVEHGEYEKAYYGTTIDAIRAVVNAGKFCVLNLYPLSLKILKESDLMPFVVFIAPPSLEKLRAKKRERGEGFKDDELKEIIEEAREMEEVYGHYFDMVIVNTDEERTYSQLVTEVNRLEREPQWVPGVWLRNDHK